MGDLRLPIQRCQYSGNLTTLPVAMGHISRRIEVGLPPQIQKERNVSLLDQNIRTLILPLEELKVEA